MKTHISGFLAAALIALPLLTATAGSPITFTLQATLNYPGATQTYANGINDRGQVAGYFRSAHGIFGYVYTNTRFSPPLSDPDDHHRETMVTGINTNNTLCGWYVGNDLTYHSFLATGSTFTDIETGLSNSSVSGVNDAGNVCGTAELLTVAFVVIDGTPTTFAIPGADITVASGLNNLNECVGFYQMAGVTSGFIRESDGTLVYPFNAAGASSTHLLGINDKGEMVGSIGDSNGIHSAYFQSATRYATWDYPGGGDPVTSSFTGINNRGFISGFTVGTGGTVQGFIVRKGSQP